jgi:hypothetical protein
LSFSPDVYITGAFEWLYERALNGSSDKLAFIINRDNHAILNVTFKQSLPIMQSENLLQPVGFFMPRNSMLFSQLNLAVSQLVPAGITQHLDKFGLWYLHRPYDNEVIDPRRILSMSDLEYGFVLWIPACFLAFVCFICELMSLKVKLKFRVLIRLINFLRVLRARLRDYHDKW